MGDQNGLPHPCLHVLDLYISRDWAFLPPSLRFLVKRLCLAILGQMLSRTYWMLPWEGVATSCPTWLLWPLLVHQAWAVKGCFVNQQILQVDYLRGKAAQSLSSLPTWGTLTGLLCSIPGASQPAVEGDASAECVIGGLGSEDGDLAPGHRHVTTSETILSSSDAVHE